MAMIQRTRTNELDSLSPESSKRKVGNQSGNVVQLFIGIHWGDPTGSDLHYCSRPNCSLVFGTPAAQAYGRLSLSALPISSIKFLENDSKASSSLDVIPTIVQSAAPYSEHNGILYKDAYVSQFMDQDNPNHVYKLKKALYGLKQAPHAWYDLLLKFLLSQKFSKKTMDPTLFIRRQGKDILLVQFYVDEIIFASTTPELFYADADHAGCQDTRRSTSGLQKLSYMCFVGLLCLSPLDDDRTYDPWPIDIKDHSFSSNSKVELFLFNSNQCISSMKKWPSQDEGNFTIFFHFENNKISKKGLRDSSDNFAYNEYGKRLMLAPRSAKALQEKVLLKLHGIRKLLGSPS
ncbi:copia protein [Tanacetum coccineum]